MASPDPPHSSVADRYRVLLGIAGSLSGTLGRAELFRAIYRETAEVMEASGFYISLYDARTDLATVVFYADHGKERQTDVTYRGSDSPVIRDGKVIMIGDGLQEHSLLDVGDAEAGVTRSGISAPLVHRGQTVGAICAQSDLPHAYDDVDLELLKGISDIAAVAIRNAQYISEIERRRVEADQLVDIGRVLTRSLDVRVVLEKVVRAATEVLGTDGSTVWLLEDDRKHVRIGATNAGLDVPEGYRLLTPPALLDHVMRQAQPLIVNDVPGSPLLSQEIKALLRSKSGVIVPLVTGSEVAGALSAGSSEEREFGSEDLHLLERLASQAAVALENARLHADVQSLSLTDPLTRLPNRRHLRVHLEREMAAAMRGRDLAVALFDVDNFKGFNDAHGHIAGDQVLIAVAQVLTEETRAMNLAARFGGDEFVAVLSESTGDGARFHANRVAQKIAEHPVMAPHGLTVSFGVASFDAEMGCYQELVGLADRDMYSSRDASVAEIGVAASEAVTFSPDSKER